MFKKLGVVTVGIAAGLAVGAPMASAGESGHGHGHTKKVTVDDDSQTCTFTGKGAATGILAVGGLGNVANIGNCNNILNDVLNDNNVSISVLGEGLPIGL